MVAGDQLWSDLHTEGKAALGNLNKGVNDIFTIFDIRRMPSQL